LVDAGVGLTSTGVEVVLSIIETPYRDPGRSTGERIQLNGNTRTEEEGSKHSHSHNMHVANHTSCARGREEDAAEEKEALRKRPLSSIACSEMWACW